MKLKQVRFRKSITLEKPLADIERFSLTEEAGFELELVPSLGIIVKHESLKTPQWIPITENIQAGVLAEGSVFGELSAADVIEPVKRGPGRPPKAVGA